MEVTLFGMLLVIVAIAMMACTAFLMTMEGSCLWQLLFLLFEVLLVECVAGMIDQDVSCEKEGMLSIMYPCAVSLVSLC